MEKITYFQYFVDNTEWSAVFGASDLIRMLLLGIAQALRMLCDALENLFKLSWKFFSFLSSEQLSGMIAPYKGLIITILVCAVAILGLNYMLRGSEMLSQGQHRIVFQNILLIGCVLVLVPVLISGQSMFSNVTSSDSLSNYFGADDGRDSQVYTNIVKGSTGTQADAAAADSLTDIDYFLFNSQVGISKYNPLSYNTKDSMIGKRSLYAYSNANGGAFRYIENNITAFMTADYINKQAASMSTEYNDDNYSTMCGGYVTAHKADGSNEESGGKFWEVILKHHWSYSKFGSLPAEICANGAWYDPSPVAGLARGDLPYKISVDWLTLYISLIASIIMMAGTAYKVIKIIMDLAFSYLLGSIVAAGDLSNGRKVREVITGIVGIIVSLFFSAVLFHFFKAARAYLTSASWLSNEPLVRSIFLIFVALACIQGPSLMQKILGVDGGSARSLGTLAVAGGATAHAAKSATGAVKKVTKPVGKGAKAIKNRITGESARKQLEKRGIKRTKADEGKTDNQVYRERKQDIKDLKRLDRQQAADRFATATTTKAPAHMNKDYQERTDQRNAERAKIVARHDAKAETMVNNAHAEAIKENPAAEMNRQKASERRKVAETVAGNNYHYTAEGRNSQRSMEKAKLQEEALRNEARADVINSAPTVASAAAASEIKRDTAQKTAERNAMANNPQIAQANAQAQTQLDTEKANAKASVDKEAQEANAKARINLDTEQKTAERNAMANNPQVAQANAQAQTQLDTEKVNAKASVDKKAQEANAKARINLDTEQKTAERNAMANNPQVAQANAQAQTQLDTEKANAKASVGADIYAENSVAHAKADTQSISGDTIARQTKPSVFENKEFASMENRTVENLNKANAQEKHRATAVEEDRSRARLQTESNLTGVQARKDYPKAYEDLELSKQEAKTAENKSYINAANNNEAAFKEAAYTGTKRNMTDQINRDKAYVEMSRNKKETIVQESVNASEIKRSVATQKQADWAETQYLKDTKAKAGGKGYGIDKARAEQKLKDIRDSYKHLVDKEPRPYKPPEKPNSGKNKKH